MIDPIIFFLGTEPREWIMRYIIFAKEFPRTRNKSQQRILFQNAFHIQIPNFEVKYEHYRGGLAFKLFHRIVYRP